MLKKGIYLKPINIGILYSLFTIILYLFGPYAFPSVNREILIIFLLFSNLAMYLGFKQGAQSTNHRLNAESYPRFDIKKWMRIFYIIALICAVPRFVIYTGFYSNPFGNLVQSIGMFIAGASDILYQSRQNLGNATGIWRFINYFVVLLGPIHWAYTPLALYYWKKIGFFQKIGTYFIWVFYLLQYICTGTNVGIFEFFITIFIVKIIRNLVDGISSLKKIRKSGDKKNIVLLLILVVILLFAFDYIMSSRIGNQTNSVPLGNSRAYFDNDSLLWKYVPQSMQSVFLYITRYVALPYYALECAFDESFSSTFGFGYSWFLLDNIPFDLWSETYMMKLESSIGYSHWASWHTAYMWFANDVSFIGVPVILFMLFYIFGKAWAVFIDSGNLCAFLLFMLYIKFIVYVSANNQVFQASDHLLAFWGLLLLFNKSMRYRWK